jgi:hypothetical protein
MNGKTINNTMSAAATMRRMRTLALTVILLTKMGGNFRECGTEIIAQRAAVAGKKNAPARRLLPGALQTDASGEFAVI